MTRDNVKKWDEMSDVRQIDGLDGQVAVVTGAASGIGAALTETLTTNGARTIAADIDADRCAAVAERTGATTWIGDVATSDANGDLFEAAVTAFGGLDLAFLNAGIAGQDLTVPFHVKDLDPSAWELVSAVNLDSVVHGTVAATRTMAEHGGGSIIATASVAGLVGYEPTPMYTATKSAVVGWVRSVAPDLGSDGVRINAICPAGVATPLVGVDASAADANERLLHPNDLAAEMILTALGDTTGAAFSVVDQRSPRRERYDFPPVREFG